MTSRGGVAAVVLAAGASTRMGRPKALLQWRGRSFVAHAIELARTAGCDPIVVVEGAVRLPEAIGARAQRVHNPAWERGQLSSLKVGLQTVRPASPSGVLVLTVDRPHVAAATVLALVRAHRGRPDAVWQPEHEGRRGHPILFPADVAEALLELDPGASAREVLGWPSVAARRAQVVVGDPAVLDNLDRPDDLQRLP